MIPPIVTSQGSVSQKPDPAGKSAWAAKVPKGRNQSGSQAGVMPVLMLQLRRLVRIYLIETRLFSNRRKALPAARSESLSLFRGGRA
jgi:hypothetical protein